MIKPKLAILILVFGILILGCAEKIEKKDKLKLSDFKVAKDYSQFADKMENGDTLNIGVQLSMCMWEEYDQLQVTKLNDSTYLQLIEKRVMDDEPMHFSKVYYKLKNDSLNLEKMMMDFDINHQEKISSPFFIMTSPKEKDKTILRTTGLGNRGFNIERYQRIMFELYPMEMEKYRAEYMPPPPPIENE